MKIKDAIKELRKESLITPCMNCSITAGQMAMWLDELLERRKQIKKMDKVLKALAEWNKTV